MNTLGLLKIKCSWKGFMLTLQETGRIHDSMNISKMEFFTYIYMGVQWLSGRVLDSRRKGRGFEPHRRLCVVVLEQDTFILA